MITLHGRDWPTVRALRDALRDAPELGSFNFGGRKYEATEQLKLFRANGIRTVEFTNDSTTASAWVRQGHIVLARRNRHSQGRDIIVATVPGATRNRWLRRDWWCKYIPSVAEWRMHIFDGSSIARGKKTFVGTPPGTGAQRTVQLEPPAVAIRSRRNGWHLDHTQQPSDAIRYAAKAAVMALGYLYGAVDILELANGTPVVLEINLLPAMDDYTRGKYVEAIRKYVREHPGQTPCQRPTVPSPEFYEGYEIV